MTSDNSQDKALTVAAEPSQQKSVCGTVPPASERLIQAKAAVVEAARVIAQSLSDLDRRTRKSLAASFRQQLLPKRRAGRKPSKEITAAYADWKSGMCGLQLYRKHVPGLDSMSRWKRQAKTRALMDAIRSRERRASKQELREAD
jgi:hypothetical protein